MNAAVLLRNSARSGTRSQRMTAAARSRASEWVSENVPSAAYTSIIGMVATSPHLRLSNPALANPGTDRGVRLPPTLVGVDPSPVARKHPWMWSLTTPTFCMNAYTLVGPTKRYPCDFNCFANAWAPAVVVGTSARDRGVRARVLSYDFASAIRLGDSDCMTRAFSTVAWILARLRMIDGS